MIKRWLGGILSLLLLLGMLSGLPVHAQAASALVSSDALVEYIKTVEGFRARPYWDYSQWTVGYGTKCPDDKLDEYSINGIPQEEALRLLREELTKIESKLNSFIDTYTLSITQNQFDALVSFSYNCGYGWTNETTGYFNQAVRSGDTGNALIYGMCLWSSAGGEFILIDRRMSEANMYINGVYKAYTGEAGTYPDSYRWVFLDGGGGTVQYRIWGFDAADPVPLNVNFTSTPTGVDSSGNTFTYSFAGWYTADGTKVELLDSTVTKDQVLYAKWKDPSGKLVSLSGNGPVNNIQVTVTGDQINVRSGPGTHASRVNVAANGTVLTVTEVYVTSNYTWGKTQLGWICLDYTNYASVISKNGWIQEEGKWAYYENGARLTNKWMRDSTGWCYLGSDGYMVTNNWVQDSVGWCYVGADGRMLTNAWVQDSKGWCYVGADGYCLTNYWVADSKGLCYLDADGRVVYEAWVNDGTGWCYLNAEGYRLTETWKQAEEGMRYLGADGYALTSTWFERFYLDANGIKVVSGWANDGKGWCYLGTDGYPVTNTWKQAEEGMRYLGADGYALTNTWFENHYLKEDGIMAVDSWVNDSRGWCYLDIEGYRITQAWKQAPEGMRYLGEDGYAVKKCWIEDGNGKRYLNADGIMVTDQWLLLEGGWCYAGADGCIVTEQWILDSAGWCYVGADGYCVTNTWMKDSSGWCYLDANGRMATNRWILDSVGWCYVGANGYCVTNTWMKDSIGWCYLGANGRMVSNQWVKDSSGWCYIGADGYMV